MNSVKKKNRIILFDHEKYTTIFEDCQKFTVTIVRVRTYFLMYVPAIMNIAEIRQPFTILKPIKNLSTIEILFCSRKYCPARYGQTLYIRYSAINYRLTSKQHDS